MKKLSLGKRKIKVDPQKFWFSVLPPYRYLIGSADHQIVVVVVGSAYGMGEIIEEDEEEELKPINNNNNGGREPLNMVEIVVRTIGPTRPSRLQVPSHIKVRLLPSI